MTVSYMNTAGTAYPTTFLRLLLRWRGSVWKSIHPELFFWLACYMVISCTYLFVLRDTKAGEIFEKVVINMDSYLTQVSSSLNFVLGFYVTYVATRWWVTFMNIPWPDSFFGVVSSLFRSRGEDHKKYERTLRMSISRYWNAAFIMVLRDISESARKRFPTLHHLVPFVLTNDEVECIERMEHGDEKLNGTSLHWIPLDWIMKLLKKAESRGNLSPMSYTYLAQKLLETRQCLNNLLSQDFLSSMPLSYTQVSSFAPIIYFTMCLIGRQFVRNAAKPTSDFFFPFYTVYEFVIYFGWLKFSVQLNPFGNDDDDFEINWLIDRNHEYGRWFLDRIYEQTPTLAVYDLKAVLLPEPISKMKRRDNPMIGSMAKHKMNDNDAKIVEIIPAPTKFEPKLTNFFAKSPSTLQQPLVQASPLPQPSNVQQPREAENGTRKQEVATARFPTPSVEQGAGGKTKSLQKKTADTLKGKAATEQKPESKANKPTGSELKEQKTQTQTGHVGSPMAAGGVLKTDPTQKESHHEAN
ncbi:Bestrophin-like protein [Aphelenchoides besseyi]|nr:Bestrophin-like protein [Aphelenchoides besseyi]